MTNKETHFTSTHGLVAGIVALLLLFSAGLGAAANTFKSISSSSTAASQLAIDDLRKCLARTGVANVYFLVDNSGSLTTTDADKIRADILGNTVEQLGSLSTGAETSPVAVNFAMGYFSDGVTDAIGWTSVNSTNAAAQGSLVRENIKNRAPGGWTYWDQGLYNAQQQLAAQNSRQQGCQTLIWFTDGGINYGDDDGSVTLQRLANICGQPVDGYRPKDTIATNIFHVMRQSGVSVFGVFFNADPSTEQEFQQDYLAPLIEGKGSVNGSVRTCGAGTPGASDTHGELIVAKNADDLAREFMKLGGYINGGTASETLATNGAFFIDPGIAGFKLIINAPSETLKLSSPQGPIDFKTAQGFSTKTYPSTTEINFSAKSMNDFGAWKLDGADGVVKSLMLFGGLKVTPAKSNNITLGESSNFSFDLSTVKKDLLSTDDYKFGLEIRQTNRNGEQVVLATVPSSQLRAGTNSIRITPLADQALAKIWFVAKDVKTARSGQALSDVIAYQEIRAIVPGEFPTVTPPELVLTDMVGTKQPAEGTLTVTGPTSAATALFCFPSGSFQPVIKSDSAQRQDSWTWSAATSAQGMNGCYSVNQGQKIEFAVTAVNSVSAESAVRGYVPVTMKSTTGKELPQNIDFSFKSARNIDPWKFAFVIGLLILLAALLPLLAIYIVNVLTSKVEHGDQVTRAVFDAEVSLQREEIGVRNPGTTGEYLPLDKFQRPEEAFKMLPPKDDAASITDDQAGTFKRFVPLVPFRSPWYELLAPAGFLVFTGTGAAFGRENRYRGGVKAPFNGQVSRTWALLVRPEDLTTGDLKSVPGKLVIFDKRGRGGSDRPQKRMLEVQHGARLTKKLVSAREFLLRDVKKPKGAGGSTSPGGGTTSTPGGPTPPPMPTSGAGAPPPPPMPGGTMPPPPARGSSVGPVTPSSPIGTGGGSALPPPPPPPPPPAN